MYFRVWFIKNCKWFYFSWTNIKFIYIFIHIVIVLIENMTEGNCMSRFNSMTIKCDNKKCYVLIFMQYLHLYLVVTYIRYCHIMNCYRQMVLEMEKDIRIVNNHNCWHLIAQNDISSKWIVSNLLIEDLHYQIIRYLC